MAQFERTARPDGDIRSFEDDCAVTAGYTSQQMVKIQDTVGQVLEDVDLDDPFVLVYHIEKTMALKIQATGEAFQKGDRVWWCPATGLVSPNGQTGRYWIGIAVRTATDTASEVMIDLKGDKATLFGDC